MDASETRMLDRIAADGVRDLVSRAIAVEAAVAIEVGGVGYAVLMATPCDLEDLAYGFLLAERMIAGAADVVDIDVHATEAGAIVRVTLERAREGRVRRRASDSACGLCGVETLEQALRSLPRVTAACDADEAAVFAALSELRDHQVLGRETGGTHAATACRANGSIALVREDVGRHNAFDKLVGAMLRSGAGWDGGFALLSSRCSYELVEKAVLSGCPMLATISAPTTLALARAAVAGLPLRVLARGDSVLIA